MTSRHTNEALLRDLLQSEEHGFLDAPFFIHLARLFGILAFSYVLFALALTITPVQRFMVYLHKAKWPLFPKYDIPEAYGFAPNTVRNFYVRTPDGVRLGVWHVLPEQYCSKYPMTEPLPDSLFDEALRDPSHPTILYMHGNGATRLQSLRLHVAQHVTTNSLSANFIIFDYRGFADSSNVPPSEAGLVTDARAMWDWLTKDKDVPPRQIVLAGHSLGTGVACALAGKSLAVEGVAPRALVLTAPYTSIGEVLLTYKLGEVIPVLQPLRYFPWAATWIFSYLQTHFDSLGVMRNIHCPILLIHALSDGTIPSSHSRKLFKHLLHDTSAGEIGKVQTQRFGEYAVLQNFKRGPHHVYHLELHHGGHNQVIYSGLALQTMKKVIDDR